jgi:pimeloyl-ACP methyl ester carboxylesterase
MVNTADFLDRKFGALTPGEGFMWDKPECPLSQSYADDMRSIDTVLPQAADIGVPWLLVHGSADDVVLPRDSQAALAANNGRSQLLELEGADHVFSNESTAAMTTGVINWLQNR